MDCQAFECFCPGECRLQDKLGNIKICRDCSELICEHKSKNKLGKITIEDVIF